MGLIFTIGGAIIALAALRNFDAFIERWEMRRRK